MADCGASIIAPFPPSPAKPTTYQDAIRLDRALRAGVRSGRPALSVVLAGNANLEFIAPALRVQLAAEGFAATVRSSAYDNWISATFDASSTSTADIWVIWLSGMGVTRGMTDRPDIDVSAIAAAAERVIARGAKVVLIHPEPVLAEDDPFSPFTEWRHALIRRVRAEMPPAVVQMSVEHLVRRIGMGSWTATRYWEQAKAPCHPDAATVVGQEIAIVSSRLLRPMVRAVAVDLDDTLWGGLVGEVGPEGLNLDPDGTGRPYVELQRLLLDLSQRGIPIGVVSKNTDDQARRPFSERPEMVLSIDSFVRFDASWAPKFEAINAFAAQLNIGIDAVCFLDDSPTERDEARRLLPGLIVPELPESPARRVEHLIRSRLFTAPVVTEEDRLRVDFLKRAHVAPPVDLDGYLSSLEMTLEAVPIGASNLDRSLSLLHKTNQFNLTLWRPTPSEFAGFLAGDQNYAFSFRLKDRVGDAGIIAVLLAERTAVRARIRGWVMSCRVFGRGVEWAVIDHLAAWCRDHGLEGVEAPFNAGPRNTLVTGVLDRIGFRPGQVRDNPTSFLAEHLSPPAHHIMIIRR